MFILAFNVSGSLGGVEHIRVYHSTRICTLIPIQCSTPTADTFTLKNNKMTTHWGQKYLDTWPQNPHVLIYPVIITSNLQERLSTRCWSMADGICAHSATRVHPKGIAWGSSRDICRGTRSCWSRFGLDCLTPVKGSCKASYTDILHSCMLPTLWQQSAEELHPDMVSTNFRLPSIIIQIITAKILFAPSQIYLLN